MLPNPQGSNHESITTSDNFPTRFNENPTAPVPPTLRVRNESSNSALLSFSATGLIQTQACRQQRTVLHVPCTPIYGIPVRSRILPLPDPRLQNPAVTPPRDDVHFRTRCCRVSFHIGIQYSISRPGPNFPTLVVLGKNCQTLNALLPDGPGLP